MPRRVWSPPISSIAVLMGIGLWLAACGTTKPAIQPREIPPRGVRIFTIDAQSRVQSVCSGVPVGAHFVLTACHCVNEAAPRMRVLSGTGRPVDINTVPGAPAVNFLAPGDTLITVVAVHRHPEADVALLTTAEPLAARETSVRIGGITAQTSQLQFAGFGVQQRTLGQYRTGLLTPVYREPGALWVTSPGLHLCAGDSGGGVFTNHHLVGLVSAGSARCQLADRVVLLAPLQPWLADLIAAAARHAQTTKQPRSGKRPN